MAASYPSALKTFSSVVNGVTKLVAALFNSPYDEISAIETMLGSMGRSQSYTESFRNLLTHYAYGCACSYDDTTHLYVAAGELVIQDASGNTAFRRNTAQLTVDFTMLDTGSVAPNTQYYIYATADVSATTFLCCLSTNATTPTGKTFYRLIGKCNTNASSQLAAGSVQGTLTVGFVSWSTKNATTVYQAATDGFVVAYQMPDAAGGGGSNVLLGYTDSNNPPTTGRQLQSSSDGYGRSNLMIMPVRKGDYWEVTGINLTIFWLPSGS